MKKLVVLLGALALTAVGCDTLSRSSASYVSLSSASASLESSSGLWANADDAYARDIAALTGADVGTGSSDTGFLRDVGRVASEYGVSDWESHRVTYVAIGAGLRMSGLDEDEARAFAERLFTDPTARSQLLEVYGS